MITIYDLCHLADADLTVTYYPFQRVWVAHILNAEVMENNMLVGVSGRGATPEIAITSYCREIAGKRLAMHAYQSCRVEFNVPKEITS